uniref:Uncharacterized protein n=1 Tax=Arundo donax TaxID=35708 RepID=A0A0A9CYS3_ARUDO
MNLEKPQPISRRRGYRRGVEGCGREKMNFQAAIFATSST